MDERLICLMDQGGAVMKVEYDKTGTLRACCDGHPPIIVLEVKDCMGFDAYNLSGTGGYQ